MNEKSIVYGKSKRFALRVVNLYKYLVNDKQEKVMSKQLLRCGTSVGANLAEAVCAASRPDFLNKVYISLKECNETRYWLELLKDANIISGAQFESISLSCNRILTRSRRGAEFIDIIGVLSYLWRVNLPFAK